MFCNLKYLFYFANDFRNEFKNSFAKIKKII